MTGIYIFFLAAGAPLLLWLVFSGDSDAESSMTIVPLSSIAFVATTFGLVGVLGGIIGTSTIVLLITAALVAVFSGVLSTQVFKWLDRSSVSSEVMDAELEGSMARVAIEVSAERRGKIIVEMAGAREQMTASTFGGETIKAGEQVVIVRVESGVALVAPFSSELKLD